MRVRGHVMFTRATRPIRIEGVRFTRATGPLVELILAINSASACNSVDNTTRVFWG